jgi:hypothetical protein
MTELILSLSPVGVSTRITPASELTGGEEIRHDWIKQSGGRLGMINLFREVAAYATSHGLPVHGTLPPRLAQEFRTIAEANGIQYRNTFDVNGFPFDIDGNPIDAN